MIVYPCALHSWAANITVIPVRQIKVWFIIRFPPFRLDYDVFVGRDHRPRPYLAMRHFISSYLCYDLHRTDCSDKISEK